MWMHLRRQTKIHCMLLILYVSSFTDSCPVLKNSNHIFTLFLFPEIPPAPVPAPLIPKSPSESESELSSEEDRLRETIPDIKPKPKKVMKRPKVMKPILQQPVVKARKTTFDEVFEDPKSVTESSKPKKAKLLKPSLTTKDSEEDHVAGGFGFIHPVTQSKEEQKAEEPIDVRNEMEEERLEKQKIECITLEALSANRISEKGEWAYSVLPDKIQNNGVKLTNCHQSF